jgi:hypothetical protein
MKISAAPGARDLFQEFRRQIFLMFRDPNAQGFEPSKWPPLFGDAFGNFDSPPSARVGFAVTPTIYGWLRQWAQGNFNADYRANAPVPRSLAAIPMAGQPEALDRAALHFCMGGPFHPGCEMTWPMRQVCMYNGPFRLRRRPAGCPEPEFGDFLTQPAVLAFDGPLSSSGPGDITKWMAVPWQSDSASCRAGDTAATEFPSDPLLPTFWPARVPNHILAEAEYKIVSNPKQSPKRRTEAFYDRQNWLRGLDLSRPYVDQITRMVRDFWKLGIIERRTPPRPDARFPAVMYVESKAPGAFQRRQPEPSAGEVRGFLNERFRRLLQSFKR